MVLVLLFAGLIFSSPVCAESSPMVVIPAGPFFMGGPNLSKQKEVTLSAYLMDRHEVTNRDYAALIEAHTFRPGAAHHPVTDVNWREARRYCELAGKRLPTGAQWEKAARGTDGRTYPWGAKLPKKKPHPYYSGLIKRRVGLNRRDVSFYGLRDMGGSVWEWTAEEKVGKVAVRGGLWNLHLDYEYSRTFDRNWMAPEKRFPFLGFRCAQSKP